MNVATSLNVMPNPSHELLEIYIISTIIETIGLRAGSITENQNTEYSKVVDTIQDHLKKRTIQSYQSLFRIIYPYIKSHKYRNIVCDIRETETLQDQMEYLIRFSNLNSLWIIRRLIKKTILN